MLISSQSFHEDEDIDPEQDLPPAGDETNKINVGLISVHLIWTHGYRGSTLS
jgi:hypothetical protein